MCNEGGRRARYLVELIFFFSGLNSLIFFSNNVSAFRILPWAVAKLQVRIRERVSGRGDGEGGGGGSGRVRVLVRVMMRMSDTFVLLIGVPATTESDTRLVECS